ncbi:divalent-cation tolerance protein CutA [Bauldia sp.]|uniref:divalent-cation tolerance protein CutA n=1 Tax=Bauldia sp. TaxID=2575872 RepID=UPI003BAC98FE
MIEVHVNFPADGDATSVARTAVEKRLAAAANLLPGVRSHYWWEGSVRSADEVRVVFKTSETAADALVGFIEGAHPYRTPGIVVHKPIDANQTYDDWVADVTDAGAP